MWEFDSLVSLLVSQYSRPCLVKQTEDTLLSYVRILKLSILLWSS
jgi:hypothetical protein